VPFPICVPSPRLVPPLLRRGAAVGAAGESPAEKVSSCSSTIDRPAFRAHRGWKEVKQLPAPHWMQAPYPWRQIAQTSFFRDCTVQDERWGKGGGGELTVSWHWHLITVG